MRIRGYVPRIAALTLEMTEHHIQSRASRRIFTQFMLLGIIWLRVTKEVEIGRSCSTQKRKEAYI